MGTVLQAVSWAARGAFTKGQPPPDHDLLHEVYAQALWVGHYCLVESGDKITWDQVRPVLRPCPEDGATPGGW